MGRSQHALTFVIFILVLLAGLSGAQAEPYQARPYSFTQFLADLKQKRISTIELNEYGNAELTFRDNKIQLKTSLPTDAQTLARIHSSGTKLTIKGSERNWMWLMQLLPVMLTGLILFVFWRANRTPSSTLGNTFGRSRAQLLGAGSKRLTFTEVAGCEEAKADLAQVVEFLRAPERFHQLGARIPHGILLVGPPGSGKTLLARAVAGEAKVPYYSISGSDFVEMFVGVGAARVRDLFTEAKKTAPCIVFIDEIDAVGRKRGAHPGGGNDEREQTLNQLLVEMDGFEGKHDIIILAATNRPDVLDAALLRPGRFDRQVVVDAPDVRGREQILRIHARSKPLEESVDLNLVAKRTAGMVGADLENLLNEAALLAANAGRPSINMHDLDAAADRVMMGPERRSLVIPEHDKRITAYHEVGHALIAHLLPHADPVHKLTIVPRGRAAGYMLPLATDRLHYSQQVLEDMIAVALAGQAAEEVILQEITTGAQNDFQKATSLARKMVTQWGMSPELGKVAHAGHDTSYSQYSPYSQYTAQLIDTEVERILGAAYQRVLSLLELYSPAMHAVTNELLVRETLTGAEFRSLVAPFLPQQHQLGT